MNNNLIPCLAALAVVFAGCSGPEKKGGDTELVMFCAAGIKAPVTRIAEQYREEYGVTVRLQFGGSGTLLGNLQIAPGDIYLAADSSYTREAKKRGLVAETIPVARMKAGFGVPRGNPKNLTRLEDLTREGIRVAIGNPEAASIGRFTRKILSRHGAWDSLKPTAVFPTVNELANAIKLGSVDVAILWDALAGQYPEVDFVSLPEFDAEQKDITIAVTTACPHPAEALRFCRYLTSREKGNVIFREEGYEVPEGDSWAEEPELLLFSGAMLRPAIQESIRRFEEREGVKVRPVFNGCGILVSQMRAGEQPDAYFACDQEFLDLVADQFNSGTVVSANEMVMIVETGNPKSIRTLEDLVKPGIRLGLAHPEKSALGHLSKNLLEKESLYRAISDAGNLKLESPTGDFLVNQIKAGSLDVVIVYRSNAMASRSNADDYEIIDIGRPDWVATQPYAVARNSRHGELMKRLLEFCVSETGKADFLKYGFRWDLEGNGFPPP